MNNAMLAMLMAVGMGSYVQPAQPLPLLRGKSLSNSEPRPAKPPRSPRDRKAQAKRAKKRKSRKNKRGY